MPHIDEYLVLCLRFETLLRAACRGMGRGLALLCHKWLLLFSHDAAAQINTVNVAAAAAGAGGVADCRSLTASIPLDSS